MGNFVGSTLAGKSQALHTLAEPRSAIAHDWHAIWTAPAWGAVAVLVVFTIFFRDLPKKMHADVIAGRKEEDLETP